MLLSLALLLLGAPACCFGFGWLFVRRKLFAPRDVSALFSSTFACSCLFFILYASEFSGVLSLTVRSWSWRVSLFSMVALLLLVLPLYSLVLASRRVRSPRVRGALVLAGLLAFWLMFRALGRGLPEARHSLLQTLVGRVSVVGVALMAALSGFGAIMGPVNMLAYFRVPPRPEQEHALGAALTRNLERVFYLRKRQRLAQHSPSSSLDVHSPRAFKRLEEGGSLALQRDIENLMVAHRHLFLELHEMLVARKHFEESQTYYGRAINVVSYFYAVFCAYKLFSCSVNIVFERTPSGEDPVSKMVRIILRWGGRDLAELVDLASISQYVSFGLVGIMSTVSFRSTLRLLLSMFSTVRHSHAQRQYMLLLGTWLMGAYFLSSTLLFRVNLPARYRGVITEVLNEMQFDFYHRWFDYIFVPVAIATAAFIALRRLIRSEKVKAV